MSITMSVLKFGLPMVKGSSQSVSNPEKHHPIRLGVGMHRLGCHFMCKGSVYWQVD